jgi:hypothetical protein
MPGPSTVDQVLAEYRRLLAARDAALARELVRRWRAIEVAMQGRIDALASEMSVLWAGGTAPTRAMLLRQERYRDLIAQAQEQTRRYSRTAAGLIQAEQWRAAQDGIDMAVAAVRAVGVDISFSILDVESVNAMIGYARDGTPLAQLLMRDYPETAARLTETLVRGTSMGYGPRKVARLMRDDMAGNAQRALVVARTEQMRALRAGNVAEYRASGVVTSYTRHCARDDRTCLGCLLEDGREYTTMEQFGDHPNGRCTCTPTVAGIPSPFKQTGREWLEGLPAERQQGIMGQQRYEAWKAGDVALDDMARMHTDPVWGESPQVVPMKELLGPETGEPFPNPLD